MPQNFVLFIVFGEHFLQCELCDSNQTTCKNRLIVVLKCLDLRF